jgi:hypothetical protein
VDDWRSRRVAVELLESSARVSWDADPGVEREPTDVDAELAAAKLATAVERTAAEAGGARAGVRPERDATLDGGGAEDLEYGRLERRRVVGRSVVIGELPVLAQEAEDSPSEPERRVEALREGDAADAGIGDALVTSASLVEGHDGADEDAADAGAGGGVVGAEEADAVG